MRNRQFQCLGSVHQIHGPQITRVAAEVVHTSRRCFQVTLIHLRAYGLSHILKLGNEKGQHLQEEGPVMARVDCRPLRIDPGDGWKDTWIILWLIMARAGLTLAGQFVWLRTQGGKGRGQLIQINRFGQEVIDPRRQRRLALLVQNSRRQREDRQGLQLAVITDQSGRRQAIHHRHLDIHQHSIEGLWLGFQALQGLLAVFCCGGQGASLRERTFQHHPVHRTIVHDQDAQLVQC